MSESIQGPFEHSLHTQLSEEQKVTVSSAPKTTPNQQDSVIDSAQDSPSSSPSWKVELPLLATPQEKLVHGKGSDPHYRLFTKQHLRQAKQETHEWIAQGLQELPRGKTRALLGAVESLKEDRLIKDIAGLAHDGIDEPWQIHLAAYEGLYGQTQKEFRFAGNYLLIVARIKALLSQLKALMWEEEDEMLQHRALQESVDLREKQKLATEEIKRKQALRNVCNLLQKDKLTEVDSHEKAKDLLEHLLMIKVLLSIIIGLGKGTIFLQQMNVSEGEEEVAEESPFSFSWQRTLFSWQKEEEWEVEKNDYLKKIQKQFQSLRAALNELEKAQWEQEHLELERQREKQHLCLISVCCSVIRWVPFAKETQAEEGGVKTITLPDLKDLFSRAVHLAYPNCPVEELWEMLRKQSEENLIPMELALRSLLGLDEESVQDIQAQYHLM